MDVQSISHNLDSGDLQKRLKDVVSDVKREFDGMVSDFTEVWGLASGMVGFTFMGRNISVTFESDEKELRVGSDDPSGQVLRIIAPKIEAALK